MSVWMNKFKCPGFFAFHHKPHKKGNKYHTICCGESGLMYVWYIVEGMDNIIPMGITKCDICTNMKTVGLMI